MYDFLIKIELPELTLNKFENFISNIDDLDKVDITDRSTTGNKSEQFNLKPRHFEGLKKLYKEFLNEDVLPEYLKEKDFDITYSWLINGGEGSWHSIHRHTKVEDALLKPDMNKIATVLYLQVPELLEEYKGASHTNCGDFYFLLRKEDDVLLRTLTPKRGDFYIMPCTVFHGVYPQGPGLRQVFNADIHFNTYEKIKKY